MGLEFGLLTASLEQCSQKSRKECRRNREEEAVPGLGKQVVKAGR